MRTQVKTPVFVDGVSAHVSCKCGVTVVCDAAPVDLHLRTTHPVRNRPPAQCLCVKYVETIVTEGNNFCSRALTLHYVQITRGA